MDTSYLVSSHPVDYANGGSNVIIFHQGKISIICNNSESEIEIKETGRIKQRL